MWRTTVAILAAALVASGEGPLPKPMRVRFRLTDGVWIGGEMTAWDDEGFDGSFGRRSWSDLRASDVWTLYGSLIDRRDTAAWADLGRVLLLVEGGAALAERAFRRALWLDAQAAGLIEEARRRAEQTRRERRAAEEAARLRTESPEAAPWAADPWPALSPQEQAQAVEAVKAEAQLVLRRAGLALAPVETADFLVYSDAERVVAARWAMRLQAIAERLRRLLGVAEGQAVFRGKAVVLVFTEQDRFRLVEAESFGQLVSLEQVGICHPVGESVFLVMYRCDDQDVFDEALVREAVHGFLHRYQSPRRLPPWAGEGLGAWVAALVNEDSPLAAARRRQGLDFVRGGGDVQAVLGLTGGAGGWPGPAAVGEAVGALLIELMIAQRPVEFVAWVGAVKAGKDWEEALAADYGVPRARLVETFVAWYRVND